MNVRSIMKTSPVTVRTSDSLGLAQSLMLWGGFRHLPVLEGDRLVGVLSERDILSFRVSYEGDWRAVHVDRAMQTPAQTTGPEDSVTEATARLAASRVGCLPVTERGRIVGLVTATDLLAAEVTLDFQSRPPTRAVVRDVMSSPVVTVREDELVADAAVLMRHHGIRHLPVVDACGELVGMMSAHDLRATPGEQIHSVMACPIYTAQPDQAVASLIPWFVEHRVGALPVVEGGALVGVLSYIDVLRAVAEAAGMPVSPSPRPIAPPAQ